MEKIILLKSQKEFLSIKKAILIDALNLAKMREKEFQDALQTVSEELKIDIKNNKWDLNLDEGFFEIKKEK